MSDYHPTYDERFLDLLDKAWPHLRLTHGGMSKRLDTSYEISLLTTGPSQWLRQPYAPKVSLH